MALSQKYLEQLARRRLQRKVISTHPQSDGVERSNGTQGLTRQARATGRTGPSRSSLKDSWRDDAKWLQENFPEDYAAPKTTAASRPSCGTRSSDNREAAVEPQPLVNAPESQQSALVALPAPLPILPELPRSRWQALLYGSRDAMLSPVDANTALRLVGRELAKDLDVVDFTESVRVNALRKTMDQCFGATTAW